MFRNLKKKHDDIKLNNLDNSLLLLSTIFMIIICFLLKNVWIALIIYFFIFDLYIRIKNKVNSFTIYVSGILLIACIYLKLNNINVLGLNLERYIFIILKIMLISEYIMIIFKVVRNKKIKYIRKRKRYTFKELRKRKYDIFMIKCKEEIDNFIEKEKISLNSDYYKVLSDNLDDFVKNDLENYVYLEYLRFYKNKNSKNINTFDKFNLIFLLIHVIILVLVLIVR